jgi:hypothetical protein
MVTITRREGHWGAILSRDGRWLAAEKMIERGQWFVLQGKSEDESDVSGATPGRPTATHIGQKMSIRR